MKINAIAAIFILGLSIISCTPDSAPAGTESSITVKILAEGDLVSSRAMPSDDGYKPYSNADITHYHITLKNVADETKEFSSDYLTKDDSFTVSGIESGTVWKAAVDAYVDKTWDGTSVLEDKTTDTGLVKVASAVSEETEVYGNGTVITVTLDELDETLKAEDIKLKLLLPPGVDETAAISYTIYDGSASGTVLKKEDKASYKLVDGNAELTIPAGIKQGRHLIVVSLVQLIPESDDIYISRTGADILTLLPGEHAYGEINLDTTVSLDPTLTVSDKLGKDIDVVLVNADNLSTIEAGTESLDLHLEVDGGTAIGDLTFSFYLDGQAVEATDDYSIDISGLSSGSHSLFLVAVYDPNGSGAIGQESVGTFSFAFNLAHDPDSVVIG